MLKKRKLKTHVRVTFVFPTNQDAESVHLVGDFNDWDMQATSLTQNREGNWETKLDLEPGRQYQFKYLVNQQVWYNDPEADGHVTGPFGTDNSIVSAVIPGRTDRVRSGSRAGAQPAITSLG